MVRKGIRWAFLFGLAAYAAGPASAAPPAPGVSMPEKPPCALNVEAALERADSLRAIRKFGAPPAPPSNLAPHVVVIRIDFPGKAMTTTLAETQSFFTSLRNFYIESSYGVFTPTFTITNSGSGAFGAFRMPSTMGTYGQDCAGDVACNDDEMFDDAKALAEPALDLTPFNHVMIYHAGLGQETSGISTDIWSVYFPNSVVLDSKTFPGFTVVPEDEAGIYSPLGVIAHEYGHQLGLPDLYDISQSGGRSTLGAWDIMDYPYTGTIAADGTNPPHFGAWSKKFLGFSTVQTVSGGGAVSLGAAETVKTAFRQIAVPSGTSAEYFLIENRFRSDPGATFDKGIPMSGLVVWHVDDDVALDASTLANNFVNTPSRNSFGHRGVDVVEADGQEPNPQAVPADIGTGDAFIDGQTLSSPQSDAFNGQPSGVTIANIGGAGSATMSGSVAFVQAAAALEAIKTVNYPNPAGDPAKHPVRPGAPSGTVTTFVLQLTRPVELAKLELDIYDMNGDRVKSVGGGEIGLKLGAGEPSQDFKWVYEYDWNGRNDDGGDVAPGVYFYRFRADDEVKKGKMVLIR